MQGLAVAGTGLQAVTTIQAHCFNRNQALPTALTSPLFPSFRQGCWALQQQQLQARPLGQHPRPLLLPARQQALARARPAQRRLARRSRRQRSCPLVLVRTSNCLVLGTTYLELHHAFAACYSFKNVGEENVETNQNCVLWNIWDSKHCLAACTCTLRT